MTSADEHRDLLRALIRPCVACAWPTAPQKQLLLIRVEQPRVRRRPARGLCCNCYMTAQRHGSIDRFPGSNAMRRQELIEEYEHFHSLGYSDDYIARELGVNVKSLRDALRKVRRVA